MSKILDNPGYVFVGTTLIAAIGQTLNANLWWLFAGACVGVAFVEIQQRLSK